MDLFRPLTLETVRLPNRIAMTALASGLASSDGLVTAPLVNYYAERARGGVGLIVLEAVCALPPAEPGPHVGLYHDVHIAGLSDCIMAVHQGGAVVLVMIDQRVPVLDRHAAELRSLVDAWASTAGRARSAGADGVMLSCADGGPFAELLSSGADRRTDQYGGNIQQRLRLLLDTVERIRRRIGHRALIGVRLNVGEFVPGGLPLHDARVVATRLASAGVNLIEVSAHVREAASIALFPGWLVPLAASLKAVVELPVMVGGLLADAELADRVIREGSADLVALGESLRAEPRWPQYAHQTLTERARTEEL